jgi:hypothetical protein
MKKHSFFLSLVGCLIFATVAIAVGFDNPRAIWVWAHNNRRWVYTDFNGIDRYTGDGHIRTIVSYAGNFEPFELDWEYGVVFDVYGFPWGDDYYHEYQSQAWFQRTVGTIGTASCKNNWLPAVHCRFGEPTVWGTDNDRVFHQTGYVLLGSGEHNVLYDPLNEESTHFHGWYYFGWD